MVDVLIKSWRWLILSGVAAVLIFVVWFALQAYPVGGSGKKVIVTVHQGDSMASIATELHHAGVIASPFAFRLDTAIFGAPLVRAGSYELTQGSSFSMVRSIIGAYPNINVVDVTPGLTLHEVALDIANVMGNAYADKFVADATNSVVPSPFAQGDSLEGLIGPGQYLITPSLQPADLVREMEQRFAAEARAAGLTPTSNVEGLNAYQLVTAASIVEKEGYYPSNMPKVARVIFNRLQRGGPLQMDATVLYALGQDGGTVTPTMLKTRTPYNTYLNAGLTPTPICVVSSYALNAVLHAPPGSWLYFVVVDKNGTEAFSSTFAQQLRNEKLAQERGVA